MWSWTERERWYLSNTAKLVLHEKAHLTLFLALSILLSLFYAILLPSLPAGSFNPEFVRFITPLQLLFAIVFGIMISYVILLNVLAFKINVSGVKTLTLGSVLASLVNGLCCTPIIPTIVALSGASTPVIFEYSPRIQAFFEFNYPYFYLLSATLLFVSIRYLAKNISCCRLEAR